MRKIQNKPESVDDSTKGKNKPCSVTYTVEKLETFILLSRAEAEKDRKNGGSNETPRLHL
jgi:hypothetical protein